MLADLWRRRKSITYLFTGYYGFQNFGDDLFPLACHCALEYGARKRKAVILSPPIVGVDANFLVPPSMASIYSGNNQLSKLARAVFLLYGVLLHRNLVLAGGSTIASGSSLSMRRLQLFLSSVGLCDLYAIGVSVGPFHNEKDERFAAAFLRRLKFLAVRDVRSKEECQRLRIDVLPMIYNDLAGSLPIEKIVIESRSPKRRPVLGVSICPYETVVGKNIAIENARNKAIFEGVTTFSKKFGFKVEVMVLNGNEAIGDVALSQDLVKHLKDAGLEGQLVDYQGVDSTLRRIKNCDVFFSVRLHGAISAYLLEVPFVLFEYHTKCSDFLDHIGACSHTRLTNYSVTSSAVCHALEITCETYSPPAISPQEYRNKALKNFSFAGGDTDA